MKNLKINESLIIGVDFSKRDDGVLIVGRQKNGEVTIINAFQGKEALYCGYFNRFDCETYSVDFVILTTERRKT